MPKENNQFKVDYDFPGLCCLCHTEICEFSGSNQYGRPNITKLKGNYCQLPVELDDGSKMIVSICNKCLHALQPEDMKTIMENVINGWQHEVDECLPHKTSDEKLDHMTVYSKKYITNRVDKPYTLIDSVKIEKPDVKNLQIKINQVKGGLAILDS